MPKNIALFIDGTWNKPREEEDGGGFDSRNSNVRKLYLCTHNDLQDTRQPGQVSHYIQGVGSRLGTGFLGGITGFGTIDRIKEAYTFLCTHYIRGDLIYIFGFSRGAFAARSLAGFVDRVGLLYQHRLDLLDLAYAYYAWEGRIPWELLEFHRQQVPEAPRVDPEGFNMPVHFMGLWDTVAALGLPKNLLRSSVLTDWFNRHHRTEVPRYVTEVRHALSLHDLRENFEPLLFEGCSRSGQTLEQMWFAGAHSDVGGGYRSAPNSKRDYGTTPNPANYAFDWMHEKAADSGLRFNGTAMPQNLTQCRDAKIHNSNENVFAIFPPAIREELHQRGSGNERNRRNFSMHPTVGLRLLETAARDYCSYFPAPINDALREVDELSLQLLLELVSGTDSPSVSASVKDVQNCKIDVNSFVTGKGEPSPNECELFRKALYLWILCGGKDVLDAFCAEVKATYLKRTEFDNKRDFMNYQTQVIRLRAIVEEFNQCGESLLIKWHKDVLGAVNILEKYYDELLAPLCRAGLPYPITGLKRLVFPNRRP